MGLKVFSILQNTKLRYSALAGAVFCLIATTTQAGFEWIPGDTVTTAPPPAVETVPTQPATQDLLSHDRTIPTVEPAQPTLSPILPPLPEPEPVLKVKEMSAPEPAPAPVMEEKVEMAKEEIVAEELPMTDVKTQRVILPQDAPESARTNVPDSEVLAINPFPIQDAMMDAAKPMAEPAPEAMDKKEEMTATENAETPDTVGFGNDIPLALALQQIAPAGYAFSFGENINPGVKVSWTGGKAWTDVMQDMIAPLGLEASIRGKSIVIRNEQHSAIVPKPALIEPAAGNSDSPVIFEEDTSSLRRQAIQDPGIAGQEQPSETIEVIDGVNAQSSNLLDEPTREASIWEADQGDSLKQTLSLWSKKANFDVEWKAAHDYVLVSNVLVAGNFNSALKALLINSLSQEERPTITFVQSPEGDAVSKVIIEDPTPTES